VDVTWQWDPPVSPLSPLPLSSLLSLSSHPAPPPPPSSRAPLQLARSVAVARPGDGSSPRQSSSLPPLSLRVFPLFYLPSHRPWCLCRWLLCRTAVPATPLGHLLPTAAPTAGVVLQGPMPPLRSIPSLSIYARHFVPHMADSSPPELRPGERCGHGELRCPCPDTDATLAKGPVPPPPSLSTMMPNLFVGDSEARQRQRWEVGLRSRSSGNGGTG